MSGAENKIITALRERRQIEDDLKKMLTAGSEGEVRRQAQQIASLGSRTIPTLVGNLDRADPQMLMAIGLVATFLDHEEVTAALRQVASQPQGTDQGRRAAKLILQRFLDEPIGEGPADGPYNAEVADNRSLQAALAQGESNPLALIEYLRGLDLQEPDLVLAVVQTLQEMGTRQAVGLLRMIAQDVREEIAYEALQALSTIRRPEATQALQTLIPISAPGLRPSAERALRKLRFSGVAVEELPAPDPGWRALVSPMDGQGQQNVWFVQGNRQTGRVQLLSVLLSDQTGAVEAVGHPQASPQSAPRRRSTGYVHDLALPDGTESVLMLEASFDLGRRLVADALAQNRQTQIPVAGVLRLLSPWLWGFGGADILPPRRLPGGRDTKDSLVGESGRLLGHPAFASWTLRSESTLQAAEEAIRHPGWDREVWVRRLAAEQAAELEARQVISQRLISMSEWLLLAGEEQLSPIALAAAEALLGENAQEIPLVRALIQRDLTLVIDSLQQTAS